jgi:hypothetical protein
MTSSTVMSDPGNHRTELCWKSSRPAKPHPHMDAGLIESASIRSRRDEGEKSGGRQHLADAAAYSWWGFSAYSFFSSSPRRAPIPLQLRELQGGIRYRIRRKVYDLKAECPRGLFPGREPLPQRPLRDGGPGSPASLNDQRKTFPEPPTGIEDRPSASRSASLEANTDSIGQGSGVRLFLSLKTEHQAGARRAPLHISTRARAASPNILRTSPPEPYFFSLRTRCSRRRTATIPTTSPFFKKAWALKERSGRNLPEAG